MSAYTAARYPWARHGAGYITTAPIAWEVGRKGSDLWLTVPTSFPFDVSIPRLLRWVFNPHDTRFLKAAALHDYALADGWDRVSAAAAFCDALKADDVGKAQRLAMTLAVILWRFS
ncbi:DUF1353 domain-containing protein [Sulfitobacter sp. 1A12157]|uniref:DUF1353 domain-containing protein n=1 Tax=Sulfitobacter sp. 1A12157 TaxID=3368594 RepID=UPI003746E249